MEIVEIKEYSNELMRALRELVPQVSPSAPVLTEAAVRQILAAEANHLLMALEQGRYCGSLTVVMMTVPTGRRARIEDVVVAENMRGRGVGRQLIARALQLSIEQGADRVDLASHPSRQAAIALYRETGFRQRETNTYSYNLRPWKKNP